MHNGSWTWPCFVAVLGIRVEFIIRLGEVLVWGCLCDRLRIDYMVYWLFRTEWLKYWAAPVCDPYGRLVKARGMGIRGREECGEHG